MKSFGKNFGLLIACLVAAYISAIYFGNLFEWIFPGVIGSGGLFVISNESARYIFGFPLAYIFCITLVFSTFGARGKYWWMGVLLIPALAFEAYFDLEHIYFPLVLGIAGWAIGFAVTKLLGGRASQ